MADGFWPRANDESSTVARAVPRRMRKGRKEIISREFYTHEDKTGIFCVADFLRKLNGLSLRPLRFKVWRLTSKILKRSARRNAAEFAERALVRKQVESTRTLGEGELLLGAVGGYSFGLRAVGHLAASLHPK